DGVHVGNEQIEPVPPANLEIQLAQNARRVFDAIQAVDGQRVDMDRLSFVDAKGDVDPRGVPGDDRVDLRVVEAVVLIELFQHGDVWAQPFLRQAPLD